MLYTLNEAEAALDDPLADFEGVRDCIISSKEILEGHLDNNEVEVLDDISEFLQYHDDLES